MYFLHCPLPKFFCALRAGAPARGFFVYHPLDFFSTFGGLFGPQSTPSTSPFCPSHSSPNFLLPAAFAADLGPHLHRGTPHLFTYVASVTPLNFFSLFPLSYLPGQSKPPDASVFFCHTSFLVFWFSLCLVIRLFLSVFFFIWIFTTPEWPVATPRSVSPWIVNSPRAEATPKLTFPLRAPNSLLR